MKLDFLQALVESPLSRRDFAKKMGLTTAGVVGASVLGSTVLGGALKAHAQDSSTVATSSTITDADILNFALNLEYLEAEFYTVAVTGKNLVESGILTSADETGPTTGGAAVNFGSSPQVKMIAQQILNDEQNHVKFLRSALGSAAVKKPTINLNATGSGFGSYQQFLELARDFEDTGVSAYGGAAPMIKNATYLAAAARIALTEAEHSGVIRLKMVLTGLQEPKTDSQDVPPTWDTLFSVTTDGFAIVRTTSQVLKIVYAGGTTKGGFFPDGVNGTIHSA
jgi:rubrerythrin